MKTLATAVLFITTILSLAGCGQALYYQNVLFSGQGTSADIRQILDSVATTQGYSSCGVGRAGDWCNDGMYAFRVIRESNDTVELEFETMRGAQQQEAARLALASELQRRCPSCRVQIKDHEVRGLLKSDTGWRSLPK